VTDDYNNGGFSGGNMERPALKRLMADIQMGQGQQLRCMSLLWFQRNPLPTDWMAQREVVTAFDT
jgi:DNA invertase Pin-like site-specific DNA recombinase